MTRSAVAAVVVVASVALSACGGEDDRVEPQAGAGNAEARKRPATPGKAPTKSGFLREADSLCAEAKQRVAPILEAVAAKVADEDAAGVAAELRRGVSFADQLLARMRALTPPKGDEVIVDKYLDIIAKQKGRIGPLVEALEAEDISSIEVLVAELRQANERARRLARDYGFKKCGPVGFPTR